MSKLRFRVVETAFKKKAATVETPAQRPGEYFAKYVFNREKMFKYLPSNVYAKLTDAMDNGAPLDRSIADEVAAGMKRWATELGVTHYTHWFQPLTGVTSEKHDSFIGAQTMVVARGGDGHTEQVLILVHSLDYGREEQQELQVFHGRFAWVQQIFRGCGDAPVVVLAAAVHAVEGLFMQ